MRIAVSGASGLVGREVVAYLRSEGNEVVRLVRGEPTEVDAIRWSPTIDAAALEGVDAVVHLAGEPIAGGRWTAERQERILRSRVEGTARLCDALAKLSRPPRVLVSASAVGFYGNRGDELLTEASGSGDGFLADVCRRWEDATVSAREAGIRVVNLRIGVVIARGGGALAAMLPAFRWGLGGPLGGGHQYVSWIGLEDLVRIVDRCLSSELRGPVNATAPHPVRQRELARILGRVLGRPACLPAPAWAVRLLLGRMGEEAVLWGARALPAALEGEGYSFRHPNLEQALRAELEGVRP